MKQKGLIRKNAYTDRANGTIIIELRLIGILVYKRTVTLDCIKTVGLKPL